MRQGVVTGACLVLDDGSPRAGSPLLHAAHSTPNEVSRAANPVVVLAEPVEPSPAALELAAAVVEDVRRALVDTRPEDAAARIHAVMQSANAAVCRFNHERRGARPLFV